IEQDASVAVRRRERVERESTLELQLLMQEVATAQRALNSWLTDYEADNDVRLSVEDVEQDHPAMYAEFLKIRDLKNRMARIQQAHADEMNPRRRTKPVQ
ncbi:hypothetical protein WJX84_004289, partial [Apatococcus fuscideae]